MRKSKLRAIKLEVVLYDILSILDTIVPKEQEFYKRLLKRDIKTVLDM